MATNRKTRRRIGSIETLERREMMAADCGHDHTTTHSPIGSNYAAVVAPAVVASATNDTIATATDLGLVQGIKTTTGAVGSTDRNDYFRIVLDEGADLVVRLDQMTANADIALYNSAGQQLGLSTRTGTTADQIAVSLNAGNYYARVNYPTSSGSTNYRLTADVDVAGESIATARNLGATPASGRVVITDWVGPADTGDYFRFDVARQSQISLKLDQLAGDADLYLYNGNGQLIGESRNSGTSAEQFTGTGSGTFYVRVDPYNTAQTNYRLELALGSVTTPAPTPTPQPTGAFRIDLNISGMTASQAAIVQAAARRWEQIIVGDLPNVQLSNGQVIDDLLINVSVAAMDGLYGTAGVGGYERLRTDGYQLPYYGSLRIDSTDLSRLERDGGLFGVVAHEIGHVLGLGTLWNRFGYIRGLNTANPGYYGPNATAAYNQIFGLSSAGVPVDPSGAHWRESVLGTEVMTSTAGPGNNLPISTITVGSLADMGYRINWTAADAFARPAAMAAVTVPTGSNASGFASLVDGPRAASAGVMDAAHACHDHHSESRHGNGRGNGHGNGHGRQDSPRRGQNNAARFAAFESWNGRRSQDHDFDRDRSPAVVRASFESAWDDLADELLESLVA